MTATEIQELYTRLTALEEYVRNLEHVVYDFEKDHRGHFHRILESKSTAPINMIVGGKVR